MEKTRRGEFVELEFTGSSNGEVFDSNVPETLKKVNPEAQPKKLIVAIGHGMVVRGLDKELEDKELNREYVVSVEPKDGFGFRRKNFIKTIPISIFLEQKVRPIVGMSLLLDSTLVKVVSVSGARVSVDFNNPLAGKELHYTFKILRKVTDKSEQIKTFFEFFLGFVPEFEDGEKITLLGPKELESLVKIFNEKSKEVLGKELTFRLSDKPKPAASQEPQQSL